MTTDPQPQPLLYTDGGVYAPASSFAPRPTSVTVVSVMGIVMGTLGLLCKPLSLVIFVVQMPVSDPVVDAMRADSFVRGWMLASVATGWVISLLLVLSAVGSLRLRDWGRTGMLAYAGLGLLMTIVSQIVGLLAVGPALEPAVRQATAGKPMPWWHVGPVPSAIMMTILGVWFPLLILYYFNRRPVREAFDQGLAPVGTTI